MFNDILNYILGLGAAIFLPIIMIILGLCVKMKLKKAIMYIKNESTYPDSIDYNQKLDFWE